MGPHVRFDLPSSGLPAPLAVPWPSDIYLDADGTIVDTLADWSLLKITSAEATQAIANGYAALDGFGRNSGMVFSIDGIAADDAIDPATLPVTPKDGADPSATVALIDIAAGTRLPCTAGWDAFTHSLTIVTEDVLESGHQYAAVVTTGVHLATGKPIGASAGFAAIRDGSRANATAMLYGTGVDAAVAAGIPKAQLAAVTVFTTETRQHELRAIRDALVAGTYGAAPTLLTTNVAAPYHYVRFGSTTHPGWTATLDEWLGAARKDTAGNDLTGLPQPPEPATTGVAHDALGAVVTASFVSPEFRRPFAMTADPSDGTIAYDASGNAMPHDANAQVPVTIFLPKGPAPAGGFPVVIFQHGLGGERSNAFAIANQFAAAGIATAAIDAPLHGMRMDGAADTSSFGKGTYSGPDGFVDGGNPLAILTMSADLRNYTAAEDNLWQTVLDLVQLRRLIAGCDLSVVADEYGGTAPTLDNGHVGFFGWSLGGQIGGVFAGVEPRTSVNPFLLDAPGTATAKTLADSAVYSGDTTLLAAQAMMPEQTLDAGIYAGAIEVLQGLVDRADAGAFAGDSDHDLWIFRANNDESLPTRWNDTIVRAFGATQLTPTLRAADRVTQGGSKLATGRVVGFYEAAPGNHAVLTYRFDVVHYQAPFPRGGDTRFVTVATPFPIRMPVVGGQLAVIHFFETTWAGAPEIDVGNPAYVGLAPVADSDDDGYCDATDTDPFDPTVHPAGAPDCARDVGFTYP